MISQTVTEELRGQLMGESERLQAALVELRGQGESAQTFQADEQDAYDQHPADQGSELFEREKNMALDRELQASFDEVNAALARMDEGTYGVCARCGKPIPEKRLRARPESLYDVECQSVIEKQQGAEYSGARRP